MNVRVKTTIVIVATLIIGMVVGALIDGALHRRRTRDFFRKPFEKRLETLMERTISPDDSQRDTVRIILDDHMLRMKEIAGRHGQEMAAVMDTLKQQLSMVLTDDQMTRFNEHIGRLHRMVKRQPPWGKGHGPGPGLMPPHPDSQNLETHEIQPRKP